MVYSIVCRSTFLNALARVFLVSAVTLFSPNLQSMQAAGSPFQTGDVFAGVGNGKINRFSPTGLLLDILDTGAGATEDTGMAFDTGGNLYATVFQANNIYKFDHDGILVGSFGGGYNQHPESIVFDQSGNAYVGQADGSGQILKFSSTGTLVDSYSPQRQDRGTDWVDLAADQCTIHYTSEGSSIKQFNVCTKTQLADFATGLSAPCYAHRIRPNFEELVACTSRIYRLNSSGGIIQTYTLPGTSLLFALNLDPDNKTFWTADYLTGQVFHIDIATSPTLVINQFNAGPISPSLAGLTVLGEITAALTAPPSTTSYYVQTTKSAILYNLGSNLALLSQIQFGATHQDSVVALLFGAPTLNKAGYGATGYVPGGIPISTVATLAEDFASGYYNSLGTNTTLHVRIIIATSNGTTQCGGNQVTFAHGQAWAQMVNDVASWVISQGYSGQVDIAGGADMEASAATWPTKASCGAAGKLQWASSGGTRAWVDGYSSVFPQRFLYDVGDAGGCPPSATGVAGRCNADWTQEDVWYVSWGATPAEALPEIYTTNHSQAVQWANISLYSYLAPAHLNDSMIISGALTQSQACQQVICKPGEKNTPAEGWQQLFDNLNADTRTAHDLSWSTDIKHQY